MPPPSPDDPSPIPGSQGLTPSTFAILRLALLGSSVLFGVVAWFLIRNGQLVPTLDEEDASAVRYLFYALVAISVFGMWRMRQRADQAETFSHRARLLIVGYALGEGPALFGVVYLFLTGNATLFLGGVLVFLFAFWILPIQSPADR
jgi:hypothetical protein